MLAQYLNLWIYGKEEANVFISLQKYTNLLLKYNCIDKYHFKFCSNFQGEKYNKENI